MLSTLSTITQFSDPHELDAGEFLFSLQEFEAVSFLHDDVSDVGFCVSDSSQCESSSCWDHSCRITCRPTTFTSRSTCRCVVFS